MRRSRFPSLEAKLYVVENDTLAELVNSNPKERADGYGKIRNFSIAVHQLRADTPRWIRAYRRAK